MTEIEKLCSQRPEQLDLTVLSSAKCFHCQIDLATSKFIALLTTEGILEIINREGAKQQMIFCSSDCMLIDAKLRYDDRVTRGAFRKRFDTKYSDHQVPKSWMEGQPTIIGCGK